MSKPFNNRVDAPLDSVNIKKEGFNDLNDYLEKKYPEVYSVMLDEGYGIEYPNCNYFKELHYEDTLVGFMGLSVFDFPEYSVCINEFYVMPDYRGNNIFINMILDILKNEPFEITLRNPSKQIVNILLENDLAIKYHKNMIYSFIRFASSTQNIYRNRKIDKCYNSIEGYRSMTTLFSSVYDAYIGSVILFDSDNIVSNTDNTIAIAMPRKVDLNRGVLNNLRHIDKRYMNSVIKKFSKEESKLYAFYERTMNRVCDPVDVMDDIIILENDPDDAKDSLMNDLHDMDVNRNTTRFLVDKMDSNPDFPHIWDKIKKAYDNGDINSKSIIQRFNYLAKNPDKEALVIVDVEYLTECPYCLSDVEISDDNCSTCGYDLKRRYYKDIKEMWKDYESQIDKKTGVYKELINQINENGWDFNEVYEAQLEIVLTEFLNFLENMPSYPSLPDFDDRFLITEEKFVDYAYENGYIEYKENPDENEESEFLEELRSKNTTPTLRALKGHKNRKYRYKLTKKGRKYTRTNEIADIYMRHLENLSYYEFKNYCIEHKDKKEEELLNDYLLSLEEDSIKNEDIGKYAIIQNKKISLNEDASNKQLATSIIKSIICGINNYIIRGSRSKQREPIDAYNQIYVSKLMEYLKNEDLKTVFDEAFESITFDALKTNKKYLYDIIIELVEKKEPVLKINNRIILSVKFFNSK